MKKVSNLTWLKLFTCISQKELSQEDYGHVFVKEWQSDSGKVV